MDNCTSTCAAVLWMVPPGVLSTGSGREGRLTTLHCLPSSLTLLQLWCVHALIVCTPPPRVVAQPVLPPKAKQSGREVARGSSKQAILSLLVNGSNPLGLAADWIGRPLPPTSDMLLAPPSAAAAATVAPPACMCTRPIGGPPAACAVPTSFHTLDLHLLTACAAPKAARDCRCQSCCRFPLERC